jgi:hypothetical protein
MARYFYNNKDLSDVAFEATIADLLVDLREAYESGADPTTIISDLDDAVADKATARAAASGTIVCAWDHATVIDLATDPHLIVKVQEAIQQNGLGTGTWYSFRNAETHLPAFAICSTCAATAKTYIDDQEE